MSPKVFNSGDKPFLAWMRDHPSGYVLNTGRSDDSDYARVHEAGCSSISKVEVEHRKDAFTTHRRIKVCADNASDLLRWIRKERGNALGRAKACGNCNPNIDLSPLSRDVPETAEGLANREPRRLQQDNFLAFVETFEDQVLQTKTGQNFEVKVTKRGVRFTPHSTNQHRHLLRSQIQPVLDQFYDIWSDEGIEEALKPSAHKRRGGGLNASYYLPILQRYLEEDAKASVRAIDTESSAEPKTPERQQQTVTRIIRDSALSRRVKGECDYVCQLCGAEPIELPSGSSYAEAHHIQPLGRDHQGPDVQENILCVCPTCHVKLDYGVIGLDREQFALSFPEVKRDRYIAYHNEHIWKTD